MTNGNVFAFNKIAAKPLVRKDSLQGELIRDPISLRGRVVFVALDGITQQTLIEAISRNGIVGILDIRRVPVFSHPNFDHKEIADYLTERQIAYAHVFGDLVEGTSRIAKVPPLERRLTDVLCKGLTAVIYDTASKDHAALSSIRALLRLRDDFVAEVHPRSLFA